MARERSSLYLAIIFFTCPTLYPVLGRYYNLRADGGPFVFAQSRQPPCHWSAVGYRPITRSSPAEVLRTASCRSIHPGICIREADSLRTEFEVAYVTPDEVNSPKAHWRLADVLLDRGPGSCAYAIGEWDGERRIGFRWNGTDNNPIGNPQSRGLPTWTMLDPEMHNAVIAILPSDKQVLARRFLGIGVTFDAISVSDNRIMMFDARRMLLMPVACDVIRDLLGKPTLSNDECRLIIDRNRDLMNEIVDPKFARGEYKKGDKGLRIIDISREDIAPIANRFSTSVLELAAGFRWVG